MKYFTLAVKTGNAYFPDFGDYDHEVVQDERADRIESGDRDRMRIVSSQDDQASIDEAIAKLNEGV